jgi:hypothetical protein
MAGQMPIVVVLLRRRSHAHRGGHLPSSSTSPHPIFLLAPRHLRWQMPVVVVPGGEFAVALCNRPRPPIEKKNPLPLPIILDFAVRPPYQTALFPKRVRRTTRPANNAEKRSEKGKKFRYTAWNQSASIMQGSKKHCS